MKNLILLTSILYFSITFSQELGPRPIVWFSITDISIERNSGTDVYFNKRNKKKLNFKHAIFLERTIPTDTPIKSFYDFIVEEGNFINGYKDGLWKTTYENKLVKTENYNNGLMVGRYRVYNTDGVMLYKTTFGSQGDGKYQDYHYPTGVIKEDGFYKNGVKDGEWCTYDEKGKLVKSTIYNDGVIQI